MQESSDEAEIQRLLKQLGSEDAFVRREAVVALAHERDERIEEKLKEVAANDPDPGVQWAAAQTLLQAGVQVPGETGQDAEAHAPPAAPIRTAVKWRDFLIGFVGWFLVNGGLWLLLSSQTPLSTACLLFPTNLGLLIILAIIRRTRWVALGILSALALNFVIALVRGLGFNGICFIPFFIGNGPY